MTDQAWPKKLLSPIAYKVCCFIHDAGGKSVLFSYTEFSKIHHNSFTVSGPHIAIKNMVAEGILKIEEHGWPAGSKRRGSPSPVITLCAPFESLESKLDRIKRSNPASTCISTDNIAPTLPPSTSSTDTLDLLTEALVERQELKEKVPFLERRVLEFQKKNERLQEELDSLTQEKNKLAERLNIM